jgi:cell division cycle protein 20 (cofactor of APC complex)
MHCTAHPASSHPLPPSALPVAAVALGDSVYLWNASTGEITPLMQTAGSGSHVTAIAWAPRGLPQMAIGTSDNKVQIWDTTQCQLIRSMDGHHGRVGVLAWNGGTLSSGSRDSTIMHRDPRSPSRLLATLHGHTQEVCGLKWSPSGNQLASGGNDNLLNIWDERRLTNAPPLYVLDEHKAAVKALAWCPWQRHVLASGGGTADRMIRFWDLRTGHFVNAVDTHSQVCALQWSMHDKELVSSHGYSHNQLILWKYPSMVKVAELTGHTSRVLHMAQSPDGTTVVSAAADETLRFWRILGADAASRGHGRGESILSDAAMSGASPSAWTVR